GDDVAIDDRGATPLALIFHELATNSAKYGALSEPDGRISLQTRASGDELKICWTESNGPTIHDAPEDSGFGSKLVALSVNQIGGSMEREWKPEGLEAVLTVRKQNLHR
ncbi:MAG TPA: sensor histidine kinase, partial [Sphingomicrobium sp.]